MSTTVHEAIDSTTLHISVDDEQVTVDHYEERDVEVVSVISSAQHPDLTFRQAVQIGARALLTAGATADTSLIEKAFDGLENRFSDHLATTAQELGGITSELVSGEDGSIPAIVKDLRLGLEQLLDQTFDPSSKKSVLSKFDEAMAEAQERQVRAIKQLLDPHNEDGPLGRQHAEVIRTVHEGTESLRQAVTSVGEKIAVAQARTEVMNKSALKGTPFEDIVHQAVGSIAAIHGDASEQVGTQLGACGNKRGDELVSLNPDDVADSRIVLEVKAGALGLRQILKQMDEALANREAQAAIAVYGSQDHAPVSVPFQPFGNRAIVVLDQETLDDGPLRLAYLWARWTVSREAASEPEHIDSARVAALLQNAQRALERVSTIKRAHSTARNKIDEAGKQVTDLCAEVDEALTALQKEICG